ncbi:hypothetical protein K438DRAFT_1786201 [Mycena galopus ATCC 62051]|nr:hypothetical protein K438DRAFT_1786201 [Mycena galopus ATCC 62051]
MNRVGRVWNEDKIQGMLPLLQVMQRSIGRPGGVSSFSYRAFMALSIYCVFARTTKTRGTAGALRGKGAHLSSGLGGCLRRIWCRDGDGLMGDLSAYRQTEDEDNGDGDRNLDRDGGAGQRSDLPTMTRAQGRGRDADTTATPGRNAASSATLLLCRRPSRPAYTTTRIHQLSRPFWRLKIVFLRNGLAPPSTRRLYLV